MKDARRRAMKEYAELTDGNMTNDVISEKQLMK